MKALNIILPVILIVALAGGIFVVKSVKDQMDEKYADEMNQILDLIAVMEQEEEKKEDAEKEPEVPSKDDDQKTKNDADNPDEAYLHDTEQRGINPEFMTKDGTTWVYKIQEGDTLARLSDCFLYSVQELAQNNDIHNPNLIYAGSSLRIPASSEQN